MSKVKRLMTRFGIKEYNQNENRLYIMINREVFLIFIFQMQRYKQHCKQLQNGFKNLNYVCRQCLIQGFSLIISLPLRFNSNY